MCVCLMHVVISFQSRLSASSFSFFFCLLFPSNIEYLPIEHLTYVEKNDPFIRSELHPVLQCVRAIHTFYCLPCFFFFFFCLIFFSIRITIVHMENQTLKKKKLNKILFFFSFFHLCLNKKKYFR